MPSYLELPYAIDAKNPFLLDTRSGPWASLAAAKAGIPVETRVKGLLVFVQNAEFIYVFRNGTADTDLIPAISWDQINGTTPIWNQNTTGNAATATLADNSTRWAGQQYQGGTVNPFTYVMVYDSTTNMWASATLEQVKDFLSLGTAAFEDLEFFATAAQGGKADSAFGWGNHASAGYFLAANFNSSFDTRLALKSTSNLAEGTNLYYTDARVQAFGDTQWVQLDGAYGNPAWLTQLAWNKITGTPTTIGGYGITDAYTKSQIDNFFSGATAIAGYSKSNWDTAYSWGNHASAGYLTTIAGIAAGGELAGTYANPTLVNSAVTGKLLSGVNISGGTISATDSILVAFGKVQNQINSLMGGMQFVDFWNATTDTPTLPSAVGNKGKYYIVQVAGPGYDVGDWIVSNGISWGKIDNTDAVISVNGFTGAVSLTTTHITEGTRLYFTDSRVWNALALTTTGSSGAATYNAGTGVFNIPNYTLAGLGGEPAITAGTTGQFWRGDKTWQALSTSVVSEGSRLYFTDARVWTAMSWVAGTGNYNVANGVMTIPTHTSHLTNNSGFITTAQNYYIGTTLNALNRASGAQTLTGVSIDGNASTATNVAASGVTGGHALGLVDDTNVTLSQTNSGVPALLTAKTITVGWTGTLSDSRIASASNWNAAYSWGNHAGLYYASGSTVANSTLWNSYAINLATYGSNAGDFLNYDNSLGIIKPFSTAQILTKLGLPSGGETLATVTGRGNITSTMSWFNNGIGFDQPGVRSWTLSPGSGNLTLGSGDGSGSFSVNTNINISGRGFYNKSGQTDYTTAALEVYTADGGETGISFHRGGYSAGFLSHGSYGGLRWNGDKLLMSSMSSVAPTASSLVLRDGSGYVEGVYFRSTNTGTQGTGLAAITGKYITGDGYMYEFNAAAVRAFLSLPSVNDDLQAVTVRGASTNIASYFNNGAYASNFGVGEMSYTSNQLYRASANEMYLNYSGTGQTIIGNAAGVTLNAATILNGTLAVSSSISGNTISLVHSEYLRSSVSVAGSAQYQTWFNSAGTRRGYFGFGGTSSDVITLSNETGGGIELVGSSIYSSSEILSGQGFGYNGAVSTDNTFGLYFDATLPLTYGIYRAAGSWTSPYPDLRIAFYTGIQIGADKSYGGTRFYDNSDMAYELFSIGNGDRDIRMSSTGSKLLLTQNGMEIQALQASYFGYSNSYGVLNIGDTRTNRSIAFGVDLTGNVAGTFNGTGLEYIWKNVGKFITPNASNNGYNTLFDWNNVGQVTFGNNATVIGSDRVLTLKGAGGGANSLLRYSDGSTAKWSTGFNGGNYIIYDDVNSAYRVTIGTTGSVFNGNFTISDGRAAIIHSQAGVSYTQAALEVNAYGTWGPRIAFHHSGVVASQIGIQSSGRIEILNNPGTGFESIIAANGEFTGNVILSTGANRYVEIGSSTNYYWRLKANGDNFRLVMGADVLTAVEFTYPNGAASFYHSVQSPYFKGTTSYQLLFNSAAEANLMHHDNSNLYVAGNIYVGGNGWNTGTLLATQSWVGGAYQPLENQRLSSGNNVTFAAVTVGGVVVNANQIYMPSSSAFHVNYSGGGQTHVGNTSGGVYFYGNTDFNNYSIGNVLGVTASNVYAGTVYSNTIRNTATEAILSHSSNITYVGGGASAHSLAFYAGGLNRMQLSTGGSLVQNATVVYPNAKWGASSGTGPVVIKIPGGSSNYGMITMTIQLYEYNSNAASTITVGGHNWSSQWYNVSADVVGYTNKPVRFGFKDGQYCVIIGDASSTWSYGQVVVTRVQNGEYYSGSIDLGGTWSVALESDSYTWVTGDYRYLKTPKGMSLMDGVMTMGADATYGTAYNAIGFSGSTTTNAHNKIFAHSGSTAGLFINAASGQNVYLRSGGSEIGYGNTSSWHFPQTTAATSSTSGALTTAGGISAAKAIYSGEGIYPGTWIYNSGMTGLYNSSYGGYLYQTNANYWTITGGNSSTMGLRFALTHESTIYGYVYHDAGGFGLLNQGSWAVRTNGSSDNQLYGIWGVNMAPTTSYTFEVGGTIGTSGRINTGEHLRFINNGYGLVSANGTLVAAVYNSGMDITGTMSVSGTVTAASLIKSGGTSSQYLMADGSIRVNGAYGTNTIWASGSVNLPDVSASGTTITITLPSNIGTTDYIVMITLKDRPSPDANANLGPRAAGALYAPVVTNKTTTTFDVWVWEPASYSQLGLAFDWIVINSGAAA